MKHFSLLFTALAVLFLSSCSASIIDVTNKIVPPVNKLVPISGVWKVEKYKYINSSNNDIDDNIDPPGKSAVFCENAAAVGEDICSEPVYKIKNVTSSDYLLYQYKVSPQFLGLTSENMQVITVTSKNNFFYEFIKVSDNEAIEYMDGVFLYYKKTADSVQDIEKAIEESRHYTAVTGIGYDSKQSGVLLGFRVYKKSSDSSRKTWGYQTLWISNVNGQINTIYETDDLFLPRKSGFWRVGVKYSQLGESLFAYPADKKKSGNSSNLSILSPSLTRTIIYAGNDYISTEYSTLHNDTVGKGIYQVIPIDNVGSPKGVKISDISGMAGRQALIEGASSLISLSNNSLYKEYDEENFALIRRNGHWVMRGRLNTAVSGSAAFFDYNIKAIPPSRLVAYDDLAVSWNRIKAKVPEAIDAYTSPVKDIAVIITGNSLFIYSINDGELGNDPLKKLTLKDMDSVVMAEWAVGKYTEKWDKEFKKNDIYQVNE